MVIRPATEEDLPALLQLSKESLGEIEGMRTEAYWRWKHISNPFGVSPVLLALEDDKLIGLRAFMRWRFCYQGSLINVYRAVDTATHPDHQGKGVFSRLTLSLIDQIKEGDPSIIFNTPNSKSMPGYLKMGWKIAGKTRLLTKVFPLHTVRNRLLNPASKEIGEMSPLPEDMEMILDSWKTAHRSLVVTHYSLHYLQWRYREVPMLKYQVHVVRDKGSVCVIIYRLKPSRHVYELRLAEIFYAGTEIKWVLRKALGELADLHKPDVITVLADQQGMLSSLLPFGFMKADKYGLTITCRKVNDEALETLALNQHEWALSAGTLELF